MKTVAEVIAYFKSELNHLYELNELKQITEIALSHYLNVTKADILINEIKDISESDKQQLVNVVKELKKQKPLAYIIGEWEFYGLPFKVSKHTLIPRPETEELIQLILEENRGKANVLDIGTGTGCIPIALIKNNPLFIVSAFDVCANVIEIAKENAELNGVLVKFKVFDVLEKSKGKCSQKFDVIVSNPPYIPKKEKSLMHKNVLDFEPELALFVEDENPIIFYEVIADFAKINLTENGKLYFEINENYGVVVCDMLKARGFKGVKLVKDINGKDRIVKASIN